jgi:hypothetical protein
MSRTVVPVSCPRSYEAERECQRLAYLRQKAKQAVGALQAAPALISGNP